jgi:hypothetical protein
MAQCRSVFFRSASLKDGDPLRMGKFETIDFFIVPECTLFMVLTGVPADESGAGYVNRGFMKGIILKLSLYVIQRIS